MERNTWQDRAKAQRDEGCCVIVTPSPSRRFLGERQIPVGSVIGHPSAQRQHPTAPGRGAQPHLAQGAGGDDVVLELHGQAPAQLDGLHVALARAGERGEQEAHGQGIVQVPQGVDERGVPAASGGTRGVTASPRVLQKLLRLGETPSEKGMGTVEHPPAHPSKAGQRTMDYPDLGKDSQGLWSFLPPVFPPCSLSPNSPKPWQD